MVACSALWQSSILRGAFIAGIALRSLAVVQGHEESSTQKEDYVFQAAKVPWVEDRKFESTGRQHNWCNKARKILHAEAKTFSKLGFVHGLENQTISVVFMENPQYLVYDADEGVVKGGFLAEVLDVATKIVGVHWRDSFAVVGAPDPAKNETFDGWLQWAASNYDVVIGDFSGTENRKASGFKFGFPILDESPVLVTVMTQEKLPWYDAAFSFHRPLTRGLWGAIILAFFFTAFAYYFLEGDHDDFANQKSEHSTAVASWRDWCDHVGHSLWLTISAFTGGGGLCPKTGPGKAVTLTWTSTILLLISAYTANLATLLVVQGTETAPITNVKDAIVRHVPVCVYKGGAFDGMIQERYPALEVVYPDVWGYDNVRKGVCGAIVKDKFDYEIDVGRKETNPDCALGTVGEEILSVTGSLISRADDSVKCSSLVVDIVSVGLHSMYNDGHLEAAKARLMAKKHDIHCGAAATAENSGAAALDVTQFSGLFGVHGLVLALALLMVALQAGCRGTPASYSSLATHRGATEGGS